MPPTGLAARPHQPEGETENEQTKRTPRIAAAASVCPPYPLPLSVTVRTGSAQAGTLHVCTFTDMILYVYEFLQYLVQGIKMMCFYDMNSNKNMCVRTYDTI